MCTRHHISLMPSPEVSFHLLGDASTVLFAEPAQVVFTLDQVSAFLWCRLAEGVESHTLNAELAARTGTSMPQAAAWVEHCLDVWQRCPAPPAAPPEPLPPWPTLPSAPKPALLRAKSLTAVSGRLAGMGFVIACASPSQRDWVRPLVAHLPPLAEDESPVAVIELGRDGEDHTVTANGVRLGQCQALHEVAPLTKWALLVARLGQRDYLAALHGAVLHREGQALLLAGAAGCGKSTLTAGLMAEGFAYSGDDTALIGAQGAGVGGLPFALTVKRGAWALLQKRVPRLVTLPVHDRLDGKAVRYVPPQMLNGAPASAEFLPLRWVVFPRYGRWSRRKMVPVSPAQTLQRLLGEAYSPQGRLTGAAFSALVRSLSTASAADISYSSMADGVAAVAALTRGERLP